MLKIDKVRSTKPRDNSEREGSSFNSWAHVADESICLEAESLGKQVNMGTSSVKWNKVQVKFKFKKKRKKREAARWRWFNALEHTRQNVTSLG